MEKEDFLHLDFPGGGGGVVVAETIAEYALKFPAASAALAR
jgi:hypothetical protein